MFAAWTKFRSALNAFGAARGGNIAITFAFACIPVIGCVGAAVDYSHANAVKASMQAALDSTALMLAKDAATLSNDDLQVKAKNYFTTLFNKPDATIKDVSATFSSAAGSSVLVNGSADVPTTFLRALNVLHVSALDTITVKGSSTSKWGSSRLRVALVLDNTGSMADAGKMPALQNATKNLLTQLQAAAATNGDVYVSIIPFVKDVNLGGANYTSSWIYWDDAAKSDTKSWDALNGTCSIAGYSPRNRCLQQSSCSLSGYTSQSSCTGAGTCSNPGEATSSSCTGNKACSNSQYTSKSPCQSNGGTWGFGTWTAGVWTQATWTPNNHSTWNGCVVDRGDSSGPNTSNYDTNVVSPDITISATLYAAEQYGACPQAVMGLSYDWTGMTSLVNNMSPNGNTNQAIGLQLGWMSLVGGGPFLVPAMEPGYTYTQVIILLTDGLNTQDRWYSSQNSIDARQKITCDNIRAAGVTLYTIQVNTGGDATSTLLQNCASSSDKFFLLTSADQMVTTFNTIGTNLTKLRVAQ